MQLVILFDERNPTHRYGAGYTARDAVLRSGVLQGCRRQMKIRRGTVLWGVPESKLEELAETTFFSDSWQRIDAKRTRQSYRESVIFAWVVDNIDKRTATDLDHELLHEGSYLGMFALNLDVAVHRDMYRSLGLALRVHGTSCHVLFAMGEEDAKQHDVFQHVQTLGFSDVQWEDSGAHGTIFDNSDSDEFIRCAGALRVLLARVLANGTDDADDLILHLQDLNPFLLGTLGTGASALRNAAGAEGVAQAGLSARRYMEQLADSLYPAQNDLVDGREVTQSHFINRLWAYLSDGLAADSPQLELLGQEVDRLYAEVNTAVHAQQTRDRLECVFADLAKLTLALLLISPASSRKPYFAFLPTIEAFCRQLVERRDSQTDSNRAS